MKNELLLTRNLSVETWRVKASISEAQRRGDIIIVLKYLSKADQGNAQELARDLLFDDVGRLIVAERLLRITELYGLSSSSGDRSYELTEDGYRALESEEVFIPKDGCWEITLSNDPLLPHSIVQIEPFNEPNALSDVRDRAGEERQFERLPAWIRDISGCGSIIPHLGGRRIRIESLEAKAEKVNSKYSLKVDWNVSRREVHMFQDKRSINPVSQFSGPDISQDHVWEVLLQNQGWLENWSDDRGSLAMRFEDIDNLTNLIMARKRMLGNFKFRSPQVPRYGDFNDVDVENISIHAASKEDAQEWTMWRLNESINTFATREKFGEWIDEAQKPFPEFDFILPERDVYAAELWRKAIDANAIEAKAWYMVVAADWSV